MLEHVSKQLSRLNPGDRFWFWLCPEASDGPGLLIQTLNNDPGMKTLRQEIADITVPLTASPFVGLGNVNGDGRLRFGGPLASAQRLEELSTWVQKNVQEHPDLAHLKNSILVNISSKGLVRAVHENDSLWIDVPDVVVSGTLQHTASRLKRLPPEKTCWFWLAEFGPSNLPFLYVHAARKDPKGEEFAKEVNLFKRLATRNGLEIRGLAQKTKNGSLVLMTNESTEGGKVLLQAVTNANQQLAPFLDSTVLIRKEEGKLSEVVLSETTENKTDAPTEPSNPPSIDLSELSSILLELDEAREKALFWYGTVTAEDQPRLVIAMDKNTLKKSVKSLGPTNSSIRGLVVVTSKGPLEFRVKTPYPGFITSLAAWAKTNYANWPALKRLRKSRMRCKNEEGEVVDQQKDDAAW